MENPSKMDDLGQNPPIFGNIQMIQLLGNAAILFPFVEL